MAYVFEETKTTTVKEVKSVQLELSDIKKIIKLNEEKNTASSKLRRMYEYWSNKVPEMDWESDEFLEILVKLRTEILNRYSYGNAVKSGIHNLLCDCLNNNSNGLPFEKLMSFERGYNILMSHLYTVLNEVQFDKGDDGFGDLIDSLPLCGTVLMKQITCGAFGQGEEFCIKSLQEAIKDNAPKAIKDNASSPSWFHFIYEGENYISSVLRDTLSDRMVSYIRQIAPDNIEDLDEEGVSE